jgi:hypothetical protein
MGLLRWIVLALWVGCAPQPAPTASPKPAPLPPPPTAPVPASAAEPVPAAPAAPPDAGAAEPIPEHEAWLEYFDERTGQARRFPVATDRVVRVGRRAPGIEPPDVDLGRAEDGDTVSRRHAEIMQRDGTWMIFIQPDTTNRSFLNGELIDRGSLNPLKHGDDLKLGDVSLVFRTRDGASAERAVR